MPGAAGLYYERPVRRELSTIYLSAGQLANPTFLVATLAHELGHEILLGGGVITPEVSDHEQITDLATAFLGVGIFTANATVSDASWTDGGMAYFSIGKQGYIGSFLLGYALALFAYVRGEKKPAWPSHLRADARKTFWSGLRYLQQSGDSLFHPDTAREGYRRPTPSELAERLAHPSPTFRLAGLWELKRTGDSTPDLVAAVARCLRDREPRVRAVAAAVAPVFGPTAGELVPLLVDLLQCDPVVAPNAGFALAHLRAEPRLVVSELARQLASEPLQTSTAAEALGLYGSDAAPAVPTLLSALQSAIVRGKDVPPLVAALRLICPDAEATLRTHFANDPELRREALARLREAVG
jgi:hypothetical protein